MEMFISIITLAGMAYAGYWGLKYVLRSGQSAKREEALTPNDLKVLEESASRLIADIRSTTDECVARVEQVLTEAELRIARLQSGAYVQQIPAVPQNTYNTLGVAESTASIPREAGLTIGEIELMQGLRKISPQ